MKFTSTIVRDVLQGLLVGAYCGVPIYDDAINDIAISDAIPSVEIDYRVHTPLCEGNAGCKSHYDVDIAIPLRRIAIFADTRILPTAGTCRKTDRPCYNMMVHRGWAVFSLPVASTDTEDIGDVVDILLQSSAYHPAHATLITLLPELAVFSRKVRTAPVGIVAVEADTPPAIAVSADNLSDEPIGADEPKPIVKHGLLSADEIEAVKARLYGKR